MVYVPSTPDAISKLKEKNPDLNLEFDPCTVHPSQFETHAGCLDSNRNYFILNPSVIDYVEVDQLTWVEPDGTTVPFKNKFEKDLWAMYPGEVFVNWCNQH